MLTFLALVTPGGLPVTLAEAKAQLRVTVSAEDALITTMIEAATQDAEHLMQRGILPQQWRLTLDAFLPPAPDWPMALVVSNVIKLCRPTVTAVNSIKYIDITGTQITLAGSEYQVDLSSDLQARVAPAYGKVWPTTRTQMAAVEILFTCGYADAASVPGSIKAWIKLRVGALYENREAWTLHRPIERNVFLDYMLDRYSVFEV